MRKLILVLSGSLLMACGAKVANSGDDNGTESGTDTEATTGTDETGTDTEATTTGDTGDTGDAAKCTLDGSGFEEGEKIGDFALKNCSGDVVTASAAIGDKKGLLFEFGAGWCGPCRENQAHLKELYEEYGDCIEILSILWEQDGPGDPATKAFCTAWTDEYELDFPVLIDPLDKYTNDYIPAGGTLPVALLVDCEGTVLWKAVGDPGDVVPVLDLLCE